MFNKRSPANIILGITLLSGATFVGWLLWDSDSIIKSKVKSLLRISGGEPTATLQPGEVAPILDKKNLWGGSPFDPQGKVADVIFGAMDKAGFKGSFDAKIIVDEKYNVKVDATQPAVAKALQSYFGPKMSQALKAAKREIPAGGLTVPWLEGIRNV